MQILEQLIAKLEETGQDWNIGKGFTDKDSRYFCEIENDKTDCYICGLGVTLIEAIEIALRDFPDAKT